MAKTVPSALPPLCLVLAIPSADGEYGGIAAAFWKKGTWISSNVANAERGVLRSGWVFQPQDCVHETFRYHDIMTSAALEEETWVLVLGTSILRGKCARVYNGAYSLRTD